MAPTIYLRSAIFDLRANLEAKLRNVTAIEACLERFGDNADVKLVQHAAGYLDAVKRLHSISSALLCALDAALSGAEVRPPAACRPRGSRQRRHHQVH